VSAVAAAVPGRRVADGERSEVTPARLRLFVGIELDERARALALTAADALRRAGVSGRFEPSEKLHVTVAFLGAIDANRLDEVRAALASVRAKRFAFPLETIGAFPTLGRPRIAWLGPRREQPPFAACVVAVRAAFVPLGVRFDRPPDGRPHLTLARLPRGAPPLTLPRAPLGAADVHVDRLTLFSSLPQAGSTRYEVLDRYPLEPER
jgi:2'-5' RNA ligase